MTRIDIWSDVLCPFCYIGKRHLEAAIKGMKQEVEIVWHAFELDPDRTKGKAGESAKRLSEKYGVPLEEAKDMIKNVERMAAEAGLKFELDASVPTNSFDAHRLAHMAQVEGKGDAAQERLFQAYFMKAEDVSDHKTLTKIGVEVGLGKKDVEAMLASDKYAEKVRADEHQAHQLGIRGVPFFVFDRERAVRGAQPIEVFKKALGRP